MAKRSKRPAVSQPQKFMEAAHMFEADHDEATFEKRLKKIAKAKPNKPKKAAPRRITRTCGDA